MPAGLQWYASMPLLQFAPVLCSLLQYSNAVVGWPVQQPSCTALARRPIFAQMVKRHADKSLKGLQAQQGSPGVLERCLRTVISKRQRPAQRPRHIACAVHTPASVFRKSGVGHAPSNNVQHWICGEDLLRVCRTVSHESRFSARVCTALLCKRSKLPQELRCTTPGLKNSSYSNRNIALLADRQAGTQAQTLLY